MKHGNQVRIWAGVALIALCVAGFIPLIGQDGKAVVVRLIGSARVESGGKWSALARNSVVNDSDTIETGAQSQVVIQYKGIEVRLGANTKLKVESLIDDKKPAKLKLLSGFSWASVKDQGKRGLSIQSPTTVAAVRGTKFALASDAKGSVSCVCEGKVATSPGENKEVSEVAAGGSHTYDAGGKLTKKDFTKYFKKLKVDKTFQAEIQKDARLSSCTNCHKMTAIATDKSADPSDY